MSKSMYGTLSDKTVLPQPEPKQVRPRTTPSLPTVSPSRFVNGMYKTGLMAKNSYSQDNFEWNDEEYETFVKKLAERKAARLAAEAAALTHGHDLGFIPAAALVHIVRAVTESDIPLKAAINDSIAAMEKLFPKAEHISEFTAIMQKAVQLAETEQNDLSAIHQLGEGWVAEETLAIAVYCALRYENDFDMALRTAVNHNGDSDSTGAVCGNILGAYIGYNSIPKKYKERLELHDLIVKVADHLCDKS